MSKNSSSNDRIASEERPDQAWHVRLPDHVGTKIEQRLAETNFESVDEYVTFALESLLRELDQGEYPETEPEHSETTPEDTEAIQDRLESLGYL
jgi:Arc/MetJ-type ribon-helix-helix transcriptional regulator